MIAQNLTSSTLALMDQFPLSVSKKTGQHKPIEQQVNVSVFLVRSSLFQVQHVHAHPR